MPQQKAAMDQKEAVPGSEGLQFKAGGKCNMPPCHLCTSGERELFRLNLTRALLPIVGDNLIFDDASPLLFGTEFAKKGKEMVEQSESNAVHHYKNTYERKPPFFRRWAPQQQGGLQQKIWKGRSPKFPIQREAIPRKKKPPKTKDRKISSTMYVLHVTQI